MKTKKLGEILLTMVSVTEGMALIAPPFMANHYYEKLLQYVKMYGSKNLVERVLLAIQNLMPKVKEEMKPYSFTADIPIIVINDLVEIMLEGDPELVLQKMGQYLNFNAEEINSNTENKAGLLNIITRSLHDEKGRKISTIKPTDKDNVGKVIYNYSWFLTVSSFLVSYIIDAGIERKILTTENTMTYLKQSYTFDSTKYEILCKGLKAYFDKDYVIALHILIPQIEAACLRILEMNNKVLLTEGKNEGFNYKILDNILKDQAFIEEVGENNSIYLRAIFTSNHGWNLRNKICHGLANSDTFSRIHADRVFLVVLYLAIFELELTKETTT